MEEFLHSWLQNPVSMGFWSPFFLGAGIVSWLFKISRRRIWEKKPRPWLFAYVFFILFMIAAIAGVIESGPLFFVDAWQFAVAGFVLGILLASSKVLILGATMLSFVAVPFLWSSLIQDYRPLGPQLLTGESVEISVVDSGQRLILQVKDRQYGIEDNQELVLPALAVEPGLGIVLPPFLLEQRPGSSTGITLWWTEAFQLNVFWEYPLVEGVFLLEERAPYRFELQLD